MFNLQIQQTGKINFCLSDMHKYYSHVTFDAFIY